MLHPVVAKLAAILSVVTCLASSVRAQVGGPAAPPAPSGVLYPQAGVTVKGVPIYTSTAVFAGDPIETGASPTLLTAEGVSLQLKPYTALTFGKTAELGCGGLALVTSHPIPVRFAGMEIVPSGNPARLEVENLGSSATVSVKRGAATVSQAGVVSRLQEGQSITRPVTRPCPNPLAAGGSHNPAQPAAASSFAGGTNLPWILGGVGAAGIVAGVLATRGDGQASPSRP